MVDTRAQIVRDVPLKLQPQLISEFLLGSWVRHVNGDYPVMIVDHPAEPGSVVLVGVDGRAYRPSSDKRYIGLECALRIIGDVPPREA